MSVERCPHCDRTFWEGEGLPEHLLYTHKIVTEH